VKSDFDKSIKILTVIFRRGSCIRLLIRRFIRLLIRRFIRLLIRRFIRLLIRRFCF
jgi:hypothetical protein